MTARRSGSGPSGAPVSPGRTTPPVGSSGLRSCSGGVSNKADDRSGSGSGRGILWATWSRPLPNSAAVARSSASGRPARSSTDASGPRSADTGIRRPTRADNAATVESDLNGSVPVTASCNDRARAYTSARPSTGRPRPCSGAAYQATWVGTESGCSQVGAPSSWARPKSITRRRRSSPNTIFDGLSSVCTKLRRWAWSSARQTSSPTASACDGLSRRPRSNMSRMLPLDRYSLTT